MVLEKTKIEQWKRQDQQGGHFDIVGYLEFLMKQLPEMYESFFSSELWHTDSHLLGLISRAYLLMYKTEDPIGFNRLGVTDKVSLNWATVKDVHLLNMATMVVSFNSAGEKSHPTFFRTQADNIVKCLWDLVL